MTDRELIEEAYRVTIKELFKVFFAAYTDAQGDREGEQDAEEAFRRGVLHARHVRDRAIEVLP